MWKAKEVKLYERNDLSYVADLVFIEDKTGLFIPRWVVVEYKCHDSPRNRSKAIHQLNNARDWWVKYIKEVPDLLYVSGVYDVEVIV